MKRKLLAFVLLHTAAYSYGGPGLEGEYLCENCRGYLTVKASKGGAYKVWLGVGGGSCGGEVFAIALLVMPAFVASGRRRLVCYRPEADLEAIHIRSAN